MKIEDITLTITKDALEYIKKRMGQNLGLVISFNEVIN